jgi:alkylhydroperoxidase/carboxymuconolactone decarboxylase family protein YurZ
MAESKSHAERHASAAETFECFAPGVDPERIAANFGRRQGALGSMAFDVVGAMWSRPQLSRRDRSLLVISVLAAQARDDELFLHTRNGLRNGLTAEEIEEILLHVAAYAGFPAAMASSRRVDAALAAHAEVEKLPERAPAQAKSDAERDRDGADVLRTILGRTTLDPAEGLAQLENAFGEVGVVAYRWAFGEIWSRPQLSRAGPLDCGDHDPGPARRRRGARGPRRGRTEPWALPRRDRGGDQSPVPLRRHPAGGAGDAHGAPGLRAARRRRLSDPQVSGAGVIAARGNAG